MTSFMGMSPVVGIVLVLLLHQASAMPSLFTVLLESSTASDDLRACALQLLLQHAATDALRVCLRRVLLRVLCKNDHGPHDQEQPSTYDQVYKCHLKCNQQRCNSCKKYVNQSPEQTRSNELSATERPRAERPRVKRPRAERPRAERPRAEPLRAELPGQAAHQDPAPPMAPRDNYSRRFSRRSTLTSDFIVAFFMSLFLTIMMMLVIRTPVDDITTEPPVKHSLLSPYVTALTGVPRTPIAENRSPVDTKLPKQGSQQQTRNNAAQCSHLPNQRKTAKGLCIIFAQFTAELIGIEHDIRLIEAFYETLDYIVVGGLTDGSEWQNLSAAEMRRKLQKLSDDISRNTAGDIQCVALHILTSHARIAYTNQTVADDVITPGQMVKILNEAECLKKKPKLVVLASLKTAENAVERAPYWRFSLLDIPYNTILYQTHNLAHKSIMSPNEGSWFVKTLVSTFREHCADKQVRDLLFELNEKIREEFWEELHEPAPAQGGVSVNVPSWTSTLSRRFFLTSQPSQ